MTNKNTIMEFMKEKDKINIKEISEGTGINKNSVMGILNSSVIKGLDFERLGKGYYKLK